MNDTAYICVDTSLTGKDKVHVVWLAEDDTDLQGAVANCGHVAGYWLDLVRAPRSEQDSFYPLTPETMCKDCFQ